MKKLILLLALFTVCFSFAKIDNNVVLIKSEALNYSLGVNAFCKLIQVGNYDAVKALIENGEDLNQKSTGLTPLMFAARHNKAKIAQLLIAHGAKLNAKSDRGRYTALKYAELSNAKDAYKVIKMALEAKKQKKKDKKSLIVSNK